MFCKSLALKELSSPQQLDPEEEYGKLEMGSLEGIPRLLDDTQATTHVSTRPQSPTWRRRPSKTELTLRQH